MMAGEGPPGRQPGTGGREGGGREGGWRWAWEAWLCGGCGSAEGVALQRVWLCSGRGGSIIGIVNGDHLFSFLKLILLIMLV